MPVRKFRSVEEMDGYRWYEAGDPALYRAIRRVWELGYRTIQPRFPPGVFKHRSIESMNALQETWAQANFVAYQDRLKKRMAEIRGRGLTDLSAVVAGLWLRAFLAPLARMPSCRGTWGSAPGGPRTGAHVSAGRACAEEERRYEGEQAQAHQERERGIAAGRARA